MQVSSNASGRGVLRLIRLHNRLNLLNVLAIIVQGNGTKMSFEDDSKVPWEHKLL